jgi:hypothetical protein
MPMQPTTTKYGICNYYSVNLGIPAIQKKEAPFTPTENKAYQVLQKVRNAGPWGAAIKDTCRKVRNNGDLPRFRKLISELGSQMKDDQETMLRIVGEEGIQILKELCK